MTNIIDRVINHIGKKAVFGYQVNSKTFIRYLRKKGATIGDGTVFVSPYTSAVDETSAYLLKIGNNCQIARGVSIYTHDYAWSVLKAVYGEVLGSIRPVEIGNNVYIGIHTTILAGAKIGDNVIIGANSIVDGEIPDNCVAFGSPAKPVYTLEEYYNRRKSRQLDEAVTIAKSYYKKYGTFPPEHYLGEHFWLFTNTDGAVKRFDFQNRLMSGSEDLTLDNFIKHNPQFNGYDEFLKYVKDNM